VAEARTQAIQREMTCPLRRARAMPSTVTASTGRIRTNTNNLTDQAGITLPFQSMYVDGLPTAGPV
jgi:hypothetical protein